MATLVKTKCVDDEVWSYLQIGNVAGIKKSVIWQSPADRYNFTYFLLPGRTPPITRVDFDQKEFIDFWRKLDNNHKERRLLVDYMCELRVGEEEAELKGGGYSINGLRCTAKDIKPILPANILGTDLFWTFRRLFVEGQNKSVRRGKNDGFADVVDIFVQAHRDVDGKSAAHIQCYHRYFEQIVFRKIPPWNGCTDPGCAVFRGMAECSFEIETASRFVKLTWRDTFDTFIQWYAVWKSLNDKGKKRYLAKLRVSLPHWRAKDRDYLSNALKTNGESCSGTYVGRLLKAVGQKKFQVIVFGEEIFCAACNCSSYEKRLWSCQRCVDEDVRPKARYCNVECQKSDWLKHKAEVHSGNTPRSGE